MRFPCQLREAADHDPLLLFSTDLKRELVGEQLYRRTLSESMLPGSARPRRGGGEAGFRAEGRRLRDAEEKRVARTAGGMVPAGTPAPGGGLWHAPGRGRRGQPRLGVGLPGACAVGAATPAPRSRCPPAGCLDMLALQGQFTFTADRPQLHCAAFLIGEPEEFITVHFDLVSIDCRGGDFLKVRCPGRAAPARVLRPGVGLRSVGSL